MKYNACQGCGIAVELPREPVIITTGMIKSLSYENGTCEVCGHQKSGWTLSSLKQYHSNIYRNTIKSVFKKLDKIIEKINKDIKTYDERCCCWNEEDTDIYCDFHTFTKIELPELKKEFGVLNE